ncbi:glycosyltransferase [Mycobacterium sp. Aquia_213]|uniref:glycosyltransferase n=1 Tax=Mycobacterium sp. Aquia_213 TaxID=2991728 RepID=UPI00226DFB19|nr:glycosyltransferase [Mycobacterium sp. Aquia_213]WAC89238.1 glycosyltransferase [Mycobacterium sp. Aquia_213]
MESVVGQGVSRSPSFGILSTYPPTRCGLATFTAALAHWLSTYGADVGVVRVSDGSPCSSARVIGELVNGSPASVAACIELLNQKDVAVIQHQYDIYGGVEGYEVVDVIDGLRVPSIVIAHTILKNPTRQQRSALEAVVARADQVIVMSDAASERLRGEFAVDRRKVVTIPHGATVSTNACVRNGRPTLLTWGLLGPGKGIERVIDAMGSLTGLPGRPQYVVAGQTHPKVLAAEGDAYRDACIEQARRRGVADSVRFDANYRNLPMLSALIQSAAVVVLPYDSTDQVTSGVLVGAIASGRPIVATAFPHAVELLGSGAGIVVPHDDPDALVSALDRVLTQPRLAGAMAAEGRRLAPEMTWPVIANAYLGLARRVLADRRVLV